MLKTVKKVCLCPNVKDAPVPKEILCSVGRFQEETAGEVRRFREAICSGVEERITLACQRTNAVKQRVDRLDAAFQNNKKEAEQLKTWAFKTCDDWERSTWMGGHRCTARLASRLERRATRLANSYRETKDRISRLLAPDAPFTPAELNEFFGRQMATWKALSKRASCNNRKLREIKRKHLDKLRISRTHYAEYYSPGSASSK